MDENKIEKIHNYGKNTVKLENSIKKPIYLDSQSVAEV